MRGKSAAIALVLGLFAAAHWPGGLASGQQLGGSSGKETATPAVQDKGKSAPKAGVKVQEVRADTTKPATLGQELIMDEIVIEAVLEKPNVAIIPRRPQPDFDEIEFIARSFDNELKRLPKDLLLFDEELDNVQRVETPKKLLEKDSGGR